MSTPTTAPTISDGIVSTIRTLVPIFVGWLAGLLATQGVVLDPAGEAALVGGVTALAAALYWGLVTIMSKKVPMLGWLLGYPSRPTYTAPVAPEPTPDPALDALVARYTTPADLISNDDENIVRGEG